MGLSNFKNLNWVFPYLGSVFCQKSSANAIQSPNSLADIHCSAVVNILVTFPFKHLYCVPGLQQGPEMWKTVCSENLPRFLFSPVRIHTCRMCRVEAGAQASESTLLSHLKRGSNSDTSVFPSTAAEVDDIWKVHWFYSDECREKLIKVSLTLWSQQGLNRLY